MLLCLVLLCLVLCLLLCLVPLLLCLVLLCLLLSLVPLRRCANGRAAAQRCADIVRKAILLVRYGGCYVGRYNREVKSGCRGGNRDGDSPHCGFRR